MDVFVLTILSVFILVLALLGFMGRNSGWAILPLFGGFLGTLTTLALWADGNLTITGTTIAAANGNLVSDFSALSMIPLLLDVAAYVICMRKAFNM